MCKVLHTAMWIVGLGSSVVFSVGWVLFVWYLSAAFRHTTFSGWIVFFEVFSLTILLPLWAVRSLGWAMVREEDGSF